MSLALALGADKDYYDLESSPIHSSVTSGSIMAPAFLILNGVRINAQNSVGDTALHIATRNGNTGQVCLLLRNRANYQIPNMMMSTPIDVAVENSDADIVTLLRLAALNEEIRENDFTGGDDVTFNDVVREFSQLPTRQTKKK